MSPEQFTPASPGKLVPTTALEERREGGRITPHPARGVAFVPDDLPPRLDLGGLLLQVQRPLSQAERSLGIIEGLAGEIAFGRLLAAPLMQREAILSSRIENTIATAQQVALYEAGQAASDEDTIEVANYRAALWHGLCSELPLCMRLVNEMHAILTRGARGQEKRPGEVRNVQNWIGADPTDFSTARFVPPPPGEPLHRALANLEQFWNIPPEEMPPLLAVAVAHYQFEAIHPFADGNGRIGRALIVLSLCRLGLLSEPLVYVSGHFERRRDEYIDLLLRVSTHGEWARWCRFFLNAVADQATDAIIRMRRIKEQRENVLKKLAGARAPGRIIQLIDWLIPNLWTTVAHAASLLNVSHPTARSYIHRLEEAGFLCEATGGAYRHVWIADPIIDIIDAKHA